MSIKVKLEKKPKFWKIALLSWIIIYPLINIISYLLNSYIIDWHPLLRTLVMTLILVPLMVLFLGVLQRKFKKWLLE